MRRTVSRSLIELSGKDLTIRVRALGETSTRRLWCWGVLVEGWLDGEATSWGTSCRGEVDCWSKLDKLQLTWPNWELQFATPLDTKLLIELDKVWLNLTSCSMTQMTPAWSFNDSKRLLSWRWFNQAIKSSCLLISSANTINIRARASSLFHLASPGDRRYFIIISLFCATFSPLRRHPYPTRCG